MPKPEKVKIVSELKEKIGEAKSLLLTDFTGLNVEEIGELRNQLRQFSVEYRVVKNTLAKISVEDLGITEILNFLDGPTAIAFSLDDPLVPAKVITEFAKKTNKPKMKAYYIDGQIYEGAQIEEISKLPNREVLYAQLVGTISAPISNFVYLLKNVLQQMVLVLNAIKEKKEQEG